MHPNDMTSEAAMDWWESLDQNRRIAVLKRHYPSLHPDLAATALYSGNNLRRIFVKERLQKPQKQKD